MTMLRDLIVGLSFFVAGVCLFMAGRQVVRLWRFRRRWDVWFLLIYVGIAIKVALISELVYGIPGVPVTWRALLYTGGLGCVGVGVVGSAYAVGRRDKRSTDPH